MIHERHYGPLSAMSIDHFCPKKLFPYLQVDYTNLYYCCGECNTRKDDRWPTEKELVAGLRFVDVCQDEWAEHLELRNDVLNGRTRAGEYTVQHVQLTRDGLRERNRDLRMKEEDARNELAIIDGMRRRFGPSVDPDLEREFHSLQQIALGRLRAVSSPEPFAG